MSTRFVVRSVARYGLAVAALAALVPNAQADVKVPALFTDHMVLQRDLANPVWGTADPGEEVTVSIGEQTVSAKTGDDGKWKVKLAPLKVGGPYTLSISGKNKLEIEDVLVGEVWVCSGQSNMQWSVSQSTESDLEIKTAKLLDVRLITVPQVGTQEPQSDFKGSWQVCTPETVGEFSAVGFYFGRQLHQTLNVPIGLIDNSWGGSSCEAWVERDLLAADERYKPLLERWATIEKTYDHEAALAKHKTAMEEWKVKAEAAKKEGKQAPQPPRAPGNQLTGQHRPANLYNGVLKPIIGYGIRGAIWYQGESNAGRAYQYRELFPLMIQSWRDEWGQGDFPFYWVQLADFRAEVTEPKESDWAELREAQTMTMSRLKNTGEAVIIDIGEGNDIHPRNKLTVGRRLARWALAKDYGINVPYQSPTYKEVSIEGKKATVTFDHAGGGLRTIDVGDVRGFAICGEDKKWVWAQAKIAGPNKVEVWSDQVEKPIAVRYAWADNPICNLLSKEGLPVTPFRTDDFPGITVNAN